MKISSPSASIAGEGMVVVVQAGFAHARVFFERVMMFDPVDGRDDALVFSFHAGVEEALEAAVRYAPSERRPPAAVWYLFLSDMCGS